MNSIRVLDLARAHREKLIEAGSKEIYVPPFLQPEKPKDIFERMELLCPSTHLYRMKMK